MVLIFIFENEAFIIISRFQVASPRWKVKTKIIEKYIL